MIGLTPRKQHDFITRRHHNVNIFTQDDYGRSECDKVILITDSYLKRNPLFPQQNICPNLQSLSEDSSEKEFLKSSYSTLETCYSKINTRFEFSSPKLTNIESKRTSRSIFQISVLSWIMIKIVHFRDEYFSSFRKYQNRFPRKILGWGMGGARSLRKLLHCQNCTNACQCEKIHIMMPES